MLLPNTASIDAHPCYPFFNDSKTLEGLRRARGQAKLNSTMRESVVGDGDDIVGDDIDDADV